MKRMVRNGVALFLILTLLCAMSSFAYAKTETISGTVPGLGYGYTQTSTIVRSSGTAKVNCSSASTCGARMAVCYYSGGTIAFHDGSYPSYSAYSSNVGTSATANWYANSGQYATAAQFWYYVNSERTRTDLQTLYVE